MAGVKVVPPKPEGQKKKEERDVKFAAALKDLRVKRREENKTKKAANLKKSQEYEAAYQKATRSEIDAKRNVPLELFRPSTPARSSCLPSPASPSLSESEVLTS